MKKEKEKSNNSIKERKKSIITREKQQNLLHCIFKDIKLFRCRKSSQFKKKQSLFWAKMINNISEMSKS